MTVEKKRLAEFRAPLALKKALAHLGLRKTGKASAKIPLF